MALHFDTLSAGYTNKGVAPLILNRKRIFKVCSYCIIENRFFTVFRMTDHWCLVYSGILCYLIIERENTFQEWHVFLKIHCLTQTHNLFYTFIIVKLLYIIKTLTFKKVPSFYILGPI